MPSARTVAIFFTRDYSKHHVSHRFIVRLSHVLQQNRAAHSSLPPARQFSKSNSLPWQQIHYHQTLPKVHSCMSMTSHAHRHPHTSRVADHTYPTQPNTQSGASAPLRVPCQIRLSTLLRFRDKAIYRDWEGKEGQAGAPAVSCLLSPALLQ
jgi:hypothetical protein